MNTARFTALAASVALLALAGCSQDTKEPSAQSTPATRVERVRLAGGDNGFPSPFGVVVDR